MMRRNILMLSCQFMPEVFGGAEQQCLRQSKILVERGHNVLILTSRNHLSTPKLETIDGVKIRRLWSIGQPDLLGRWVLFSLLWLLQVICFSFKHKHSFDIVHCHQGKYGLFIGSIIARIFKVPQIVKIGNSRDALDVAVLQNKKLFGPLCVKIALAVKPVFVAISQVIAKDLADFGIDPKYIKRVNNGISAVDAPFTKTSGNITFFWHGRFEPIKNLKFMLHSFAEALKQRDDITLNLIGAGTQKKELLNLCNQLNINNAVNFVSPPENIMEHIVQYDIFVNTSLFEGMSNSMQEAMKTGKLMVSTRVSGTHEMIDEDVNGFTIDQGNTTEMGNAMLKAAAMFEEKAETIHEYNLEKTRNEFAIEKIVSQYEALYDELLQS